MVENGIPPMVDRREALGRGLRGASLLLGASLLGACDRIVPDRAPTLTASPTIDPAAFWAQQHQTGRMSFANWPYYVDLGAGNRRPSLELFTRETGIHVQYFHPIQENAAFLESIQPYLEAGLPTFYDLIVMTNGPEVNRLIASGWLTPLDQSLLPNFHRYASDLVRDPNWDPGNRYTVAWQSGLTGIAYRPEAVEALGRRPRSIHDLFDPALEGRVGMMSDLNDLGSAGLLAIDVVPGESTQDDWLRAADALREQRAAGVVRSYYGQSYIGALRRGDTWASQAWSGDVFQAQQLGTEELTFVVPEEGALLWTDNMMIPLNARHPLDAMTYIDFVYRPDVAAMIADWVWYVCPVPAARRIIAKQLGDPAVANSPLVFPTPDALASGALKQYRVFENEEEAATWESIFGAVSLGL